MSGHNKWSKIKRKKGASDAKKGKVFAKIIREITVAARRGGGDPDGNPRLRLAMDKAKTANMPTDNVQRAVKKGTGEGGEENLEEFCLEGYGPGGVALLIEALSDNRNRTISDVRHILSKNNGNMGEAGCVNWMFTKRGLLTFSKETNEEKLMNVAIEAGAEDIQTTDEGFEVYTAHDALTDVQAACERSGLKPEEASLQMVPQNTVHIEGTNAEKMLKLMEALEDHDDVQNIHANFDIDEAVLEKIAS